MPCWTFLGRKRRRVQKDIIIPVAKEHLCKEKNPLVEVVLPRHMKTGIFPQRYHVRPEEKKPETPTHRLHRSAHEIMETMPPAFIGAFHPSPLEIPPKERNIQAAPPGTSTNTLEIMSGISVTAPAGTALAFVAASPARIAKGKWEGWRSRAAKEGLLWTVAGYVAGVRIEDPQSEYVLDDGRVVWGLHGVGKGNGGDPLGVYLAALAYDQLSPDDKAVLGTLWRQTGWTALDEFKEALVRVWQQKQETPTAPPPTFSLLNDFDLHDFQTIVAGKYPFEARLLAGAAAFEWFRARYGIYAPLGNYSFPQLLERVQAGGGTINDLKTFLEVIRETVNAIQEKDPGLLQGLWLPRRWAETETDEDPIVVGWGRLQEAIDDLERRLQGAAARLIYRDRDDLQEYSNLVVEVALAAMRGRREQELAERRIPIGARDAVLNAFRALVKVAANTELPTELRNYVRQWESQLTQVAGSKRLAISLGQQAEKQAQDIERAAQRAQRLLTAKNLLSLITTPQDKSLLSATISSYFNRLGAMAASEIAVQSGSLTL